MNISNGHTTITKDYTPILSLKFKLVFLVLIIFNQANAQNEDRKMLPVGVSSSSKIDKLYDKDTGEQIPDEEVYNILTADPKLTLEPVVDKYGKIIKHLYDRNQSSDYKRRDANRQTKIGEHFPEFVFTTSTQQTIESSDLIGKYVFIRFELFARSKFMQMDKIEDLNKQINDLKNKDQIVAFLSFSDTNENIAKNLSLQFNHLNLVGDGGNFHMKYNITEYPYTVLLDKQGNVLNYYSSIDDIDIQSILTSDE